MKRKVIKLLNSLSILIIIICLSACANGKGGELERISFFYQQGTTTDYESYMYYDDDYFSGTVVFKFNGKFYRGEYVNEIINFGKDRGKEKIDIDIIEVGDDDYTSIHNEKIENMIKDIFKGSREVGEKFTMCI